MSANAAPAAGGSPPSAGEVLPAPSCDYLQISLGADGRVQVRGTQAAVAEFLDLCAQAGLVLDSTQAHWCG